MQYDVIVVGGGHAGCEAAAAAARMGKSVALVTMKVDQIARLSCNPAVGGLAKGHLVRELDALGGLMGRAADECCIQFRKLNTRKGLAVQSSRAQVDIDRYPETMQRLLGEIANLHLVEGECTDLLLTDGAVKGVTLNGDTPLLAPAVIMTTGTFLAGVMHCGEEKTVGGRIGDEASHALSDSLNQAGVRLGRLKTGTVPRLKHSSIAWDELEVQHDTDPEGRFSFHPVERKLRQVECHMAYTTAETHAIIQNGLDRSPLFTGQIEGTGPRYCPSIEDKVVRFPQRERHLLFLEPEGLESERVYINGLSTSLPHDIQDAMLRSIKGLENVEVIQWGYAVEYDYADPRDLSHGLEHKGVKGLFFAGQVNGTSGYEEAAVQGFIAGVSAAQGSPFILGRDEAYIGVLIDDLVSKGIGGEPYRMFTSRAEHRLILREDNADRRLTPKGRELGLIDQEDWDRLVHKLAVLDETRTLLGNTLVMPNKEVQQTLVELNEAKMNKPLSAESLLRRPSMNYASLRRLAPQLPELDPAFGLQVEIDVKYAGYIDRAERRARKAAKMENVRIPEGLDWSTLTALSVEVRERLTRAAPETLGQAARLPGITPAAVNLVATWLAKQSRQRSGARPLQ